MSQHTHQSSYREKLIEHLLLGELLKVSWRNDCALEIARPEVDNSGYDAIVEVKSVIRHVQIKASIVGGKTASQKIHVRLADKPSGCVVWVFFREDLSLKYFLFFGGASGEPLGSLDTFKVARHTKGNKDGFKAERQNLRVTPKRRFKRIETVDALYGLLFS